MIRNINANLKSVAVDPSDDFRKLNDLNNPYCYNFGRAKREHSHSCDFQKLHNRVNFDYFNKR
ncbi:MAG: hypothetical protein HFG33_00745 [Bacilli bacterium]|nr:hypothetical protein [Bacilli bacterium]